MSLSMSLSMPRLPSGRTSASALPPISVLRTVSCAAVVLALAPCAEGSLLFASDPGLNGLGIYSGSIEWSYEGDGIGTLEITLANDSPAANAGALTGFAFNAIDGLAVAFTSGLPSWSGVEQADASPYPLFDFGAAIGGNFLGGNPQFGIAVGASAAFVFTVKGLDSLLATIDESAFFDASGGYGFVARFRGFLDGGSDKVTASLVPAPGALALLGLAGACARRRR